MSTPTAVYSAAVECRELHISTGGDKGESFSEDSAEASVVLQCDYDDRFDLIDDLLSNRRQWPYGGMAMYATTAAAQPFGQAYYAEDGKSINYEYALITVGYTSDSESDLISETLETRVEFITQDYRNFRWENGDPLLEAEAPGKQVHSLALKRTLHKVVAIDASILSLPGAINNAAYTSSLLGLTFPKASLLFEPSKLSRTITTAGAKAWNIELSFLYKQDGWNRFWRHKTENYEAIYRSEDLAEPYKSYPEKSFAAFLA